MAHYSLLELIIDRLLLLVYLSGTSIDSSLITENEGSFAQRKNSNSKITHVSAGLAIKKYWNKLTQLMSNVRHLNQQNRSLQLKHKEDHRESVLSHQSDKINQKPPMNTKKNPEISNDIGFKSTQTNETSFVPCEACAKVQTNLKQNADQLINMCHYQDIQSQVGKYRASLMANQLVGGWLSGTELEKWLHEQDKDLNKVSKQLEFLKNNNKLLNTKLVTNEESINKFQTIEKDLKKVAKEEKDSMSVTMKQYEKKLGDQKSELDLRIKNLENEIKSLSDLKNSLDQKYENLKNLHENNEKIIVELNETNRMISSELELKCDQQEKQHHAEEELLVARTELDCLKRELSDKNINISTEREKLEELIRTQESFKSKYEISAGTVDKLTVEKESAEKKYNTVQKEKESFLELIQQKKEQIENLEQEKDILKSSISKLKTEVNKLKDNEVLLLRYPDLYGPIEQLEELSVCSEMENQISANSHRICLLENLNENLNNSVRKLSATVQESRTNSSNGNNRRNQSMIINKGAIEMNDKNEFMKLDDSRKSVTPKLDRQIPSRAYPLFKLDNEIEQEEEVLKKAEEEKTWTQNQSYSSLNERHGSAKSTRTPGDLPIKPIFTQNISNSNQNSDNSRSGSPGGDLNNHFCDENDEELNDFMSNKHAADKSYLNKLNQIGQNSELRVESNTDFSLMNRRNVPSRENSFLYSPAPPSDRGDRPNSSKLSYYSTKDRSNSAKNIRNTPIPPADKTMEVVVGKGRLRSVQNSARSNKNLPPQTPTSRPKSGLKSANTSANFQCENCPKKYNNRKDLDIHKMYCS